MQSLGRSQPSSSSSSPATHQQQQQPPLPPPLLPPPLPSTTTETQSLGMSASDPHIIENGHEHGLPGPAGVTAGVPIVPPKVIAEAFLGMNNYLALYEDFVQIGEGTYG